VSQDVEACRGVLDPLSPYGYGVTGIGEKMEKNSTFYPFTPPFAAQLPEIMAPSAGLEPATPGLGSALGEDQNKARNSV
jgi:hypothetical protein